VASGANSTAAESRSRWLAGVLGLGLALALGVIAVLAKRDREQQARIDALAGEMASLRDSVHAAVVPSPPGIALRSACALDSEQLDAVKRAVEAAMAHPASGGGTTPPSRSAASEPQAAGAKPPERTAEQEAALARANDVLDDALRRRSLTRADVDQLRGELAAAGPSDEAQEIRRKIAAAVNRKELVPDGPHFIP
jgi:hypothetical protein